MVDQHPHLLAIDDDEDSAKLIARVAAKCDYTTNVLTDSRALERVLVERAPDIISLDLSMPEVDGLQALDVLRRAKFAGYVMIVSGHPTCMRQHVSGVAKTGGLKVAGHFQKPINTAELARVLKDLKRDRLKREPEARQAPARAI